MPIVGITPDTGFSYTINKNKQTQFNDLSLRSSVAHTFVLEKCVFCNGADASNYNYTSNVFSGYDLWVNGVNKTECSWVGIDSYVYENYETYNLTVIACATKVGDFNDNGTQGVQGVKGDQGVQGVQGLKGNDGSGNQGTQGVQGVQGLKGSNGSDGNQGVQGIQGIQGFQGLSGDGRVILVTTDVNDNVFTVEEINGKTGITITDNTVVTIIFRHSFNHKSCYDGNPSMPNMMFIKCRRMEQIYYQFYDGKRRDLGARGYELPVMYRFCKVSHYENGYGVPAPILGIDPLTCEKYAVGVDNVESLQIATTRYDYLSYHDFMFSSKYCCPKCEIYVYGCGDKYGYLYDDEEIQEESYIVNGITHNVGCADNYNVVGMLGNSEAFSALSKIGHFDTVHKNNKKNESNILRAISETNGIVSLQTVSGNYPLKYGDEFIVEFNKNVDFDWGYEKWLIFHSNDNIFDGHNKSACFYKSSTVDGYGDTINRDYMVMPSPIICLDPITGEKYKTSGVESYDEMFGCGDVHKFIFGESIVPNYYTYDNAYDGGTVSPSSWYYNYGSSSFYYEHYDSSIDDGMVNSNNIGALQSCYVGMQHIGLYSGGEYCVDGEFYRIVSSTKVGDFRSIESGGGGQGNQGVQGTQGVQGVQGLQGLLGLQGLQGLQGVYGIQGLQGTTGSIGPSNHDFSFYEGYFIDNYIADEYIELDISGTTHPITFEFFANERDYYMVYINDLNSGASGTNVIPIYILSGNESDNYIKFYNPTEYDYTIVFQNIEYGGSAVTDIAQPSSITVYAGKATEIGIITRGGHSGIVSVYLESVGISGCCESIAVITAAENLEWTHAHY